MLLLLFSLMVHAREIPTQTQFQTFKAVPFVQGQFKSEGQFQLQSHQRSEEVSIATAEGQMRLDELLTEGYQCKAKTDETTICLKALQIEGGVHPGLPEAVEAQWKDQFFSFEAVVGEPELVTNTEFYKQWLVPQKAVLWEIPNEKEKYVWNPLSYVWMQDDWNVYLGSAFSSPYFAIKIENETLQLSEKIEIRKGPVMDRYFVQILFVKVNENE